MRKKDSLSTVLLAAAMMILIADLTLTAADVTLTWSAPVTNTDGSPIVRQTGYKVHYGYSSQSYSSVIDAGESNIFTLTDAVPDQTHFFAVTCYDSMGNESGLSDEIAWIHDASADPDEDGVPDSWEIQHFGTPALEAPASSSDSDEDGSDDLSEYIAGTSPADSSSSPDISLKVERQIPAVVFTARQSAGPSYEGRVRYMALEYCDDLISSNWQPVPGYEYILATNQEVAHTNLPPGHFRYYRFRAWLQPE